MNIAPKIFSEDEQIQIKATLGSASMQNIERVVLGMRDAKMLAGGDDSVNAEKYPKRGDNAAKQFEDARRYQHFIEVLAELKEIDRRGEKFSTIEIKPTTVGEITT